jgi:transcriptional regulator GlxA family with amidase domain
MTNGQSSVRNQTSAPVQVLRERVIARRRRARKERRETANWVVARSRRQKVRTLAVCAGTLLLMALGLYLGLAHQEVTGPFESATPIGGAAGIV